MDIEIDIYGLVSVGEVFGLGDHHGVLRIGLGEEVAVRRAPTRNARRRGHGNEGERPAFEIGGANRNLRAADEADAAMVEVVGVDVRHHMRHQVPAELAARIGEAIGELLRLRQQ
jgi:hypothetical protein